MATISRLAVGSRASLTGVRGSGVGVTLLLSSGMRPARRAAMLIGAPIILIGASYVAMHDYVRSAAFVVEAAGMQGLPRRVAQWETFAVTEAPLTVPWRGGAPRARRYE